MNSSRPVPHRAEPEPEARATFFAKRPVVAVLLGVTLATGLACSLGRTTDCGNYLSACSPIPPSPTTAPAAAPGAWPTGAVFEVAALVQDGQQLDLADGLDATLTFREPGELEVFTGCNTLHVSGDFTDDRITPATVTFPSALPCPTRPSEFGQWLTDFFEAAPTLAVAGDQLTLETDHAKLLAERQ
jgi:hypothetical protein